MKKLSKLDVWRNIRKPHDSKQISHPDGMLYLKNVINFCVVFFFFEVCIYFQGEPHV